MRRVRRARRSDRGEPSYRVGRSQEDGAPREVESVHPRGDEFSDRLDPALAEHAAIGPWAARKASPSARIHPHSDEGTESYRLLGPVGLERPTLGSRTGPLARPVEGGSPFPGTVDARCLLCKSRFLRATSDDVATGRGGTASNSSATTVVSGGVGSRRCPPLPTSAAPGFQPRPWVRRCDRPKRRRVAYSRPPRPSPPIRRSLVLLRTPRLSTRCGYNLPDPGSSHRCFPRVKDDFDRALAALPGCVR
jgi:hypothetical protein